MAMKARRADRIVVFNAPEGMEAGIRKAVSAGFRALRRAAPGEYFSALIYFRSEESVFTAGECIGPREIAIRIDPGNFRRRPEKARLLALQGTAVHEAVHCLRSSKKIKTILQALLNEGISCFVQTELAGPPDYLDFEETREEDIQKWWRWWRKSYFRMNKDKDGGFWDAAPQRTAAYRIGYHIVSSYWDAHPGMTLGRLIRTDFRTLEAFADKLFRPSRTAKG